MPRTRRFVLIIGLLFQATAAVFLTLALVLKGRGAEEAAWLHGMWQSIMLAVSASAAASVIAFGWRKTLSRPWFFALFLPGVGLVLWFFAYLVWASLA